jgi:3'5'-cyclic nucleotide phosphodiesterase
MYRDNPFHNFAHASHVAMSVSKLLSRIVAPSETESGKEKDYTSHDYAYGISSDPLTHFSCVISALIHDVEHPGVPNAQLVRENAPLAETYDGQSVAEQHSVTLSWNLLQDAKYAALRRTIYTTHDELLRFRQIIVNAVMATDIVDKNLKLLRNLRWDRAFSTSLTMALHGHRDMMDRKATIVIEHLIQASDVAHTMQHWHVYRKWNELFFLECYQAFADGRADHDPLDGWYEGELGFFDHYIIPLAKKLKDCGVFGVSCDEYLNYALQNRREWEKRGRDVVNEMRELVRNKMAPPDEYLNFALRNRREREKRGRDVVHEMRELVGGKKAELVGGKKTVSPIKTISAWYFI